MVLAEFIYKTKGLIQAKIQSWTTNRRNGLATILCNFLPFALITRGWQVLSPAVIIEALAALATYSDPFNKFDLIANRLINKVFIIPLDVVNFTPKVFIEVLSPVNIAKCLH